MSVKVKSLLGACVLASIAATAWAEPLNIAVIEALSGTQNSTGRPYVIATRYVMDKVNKTGGFNGEKVTIKEYDHAGNSATLSTKIKQSISEGARVIVQGSSSAISAQIADELRDYNDANPGKEVIFLNVGSLAMNLTGSKCNFYSFRIMPTAPMLVGALVRVMKEEGTLGKKIYAINQNYSWGQDVDAAIKQNTATGGYEVVDSVLHEVNRIQDFSPFVTKIQASKADAVITGNWSNDLLLLMKAIGDAELKVRFGTTFLDQEGNISNAGETAIGSYVAHIYNVDATKGELAADYEKTTNHRPTYVEPQTILGVQMLAKALETVNFNGGAIDATKLVLALEGVTLKTEIGTQTFRKEDHQAIVPVVVSRVEKGVKYPVDGTDLGFKAVKVFPAGEVTYPVQATCQMRRPS